MADTLDCIPTVCEAFFKPLPPCIEASAHARQCPSLTDFDWLKLGVTRVIGDHPSGRAFLQQALGLGRNAPTHQHFFESLKSARRLRLCRDAAARLFQQAASQLTDPLAAIGDLADFEVLAGDGHWIGHACHDARKTSDQGEEKHYPVGHLYLLDLRRHLLRHLALGDQVNRRKEHDMRTLKREGAAGLRAGIPTGRKLLIAWDPAGIDFRFWYELKHGHGIYFVSRAKENFAVIRCGNLPWNEKDPVNLGVVSDEQIGIGNTGVMIRRVTYTDPASGTTYEFITNEMTLRPGVIAQVYRMRWDIEKVFDELKNKLHQTKAWATSATAKAMQAQFICLAHNLMRLLEERLAKQGVRNEMEERRRAERSGLEPKQRRVLAIIDPTPPRWAECLRGWLARFTQRGVKFIRWLRAQLLAPSPWDEACSHLRRIYDRR